MAFAASQADGGLKARVINDASKTAGSFTMTSPTGNAKVKVTPLNGVNRLPEADDGTPVDILTEDFSGFNTGEYGNPDLSMTLIYTNAEYQEIVGDAWNVWTNMKPGYTKVEGWGGEGYVCKAGGAAYMRAENSTYGFARLNTPMLQCADNDGVTYFEFRARSAGAGITSQGVHVGFHETNNMSSNGWTSGLAPLVDITDEWNLYQFEFKGTGPTTLFTIEVGYDDFVGTDASLYIDDVRVYQKKPSVAMPVCLPHSEYKGNSFVANWAPVEGAVSYLLNVYTYDEGTDNKFYHLQEQAVEGTSYEVTGVESGVTYYYTVYALNAAGKVSRESMEQEVYDLETPVLEVAEGINSEGVYKAKWSDVPTAERYNYWAAYKRTADADKEMIVTHENFNEVKLSEADGGEAADYDPVGRDGDSDNYLGSYSDYFIPEMNQAGWEATHYVVCKGYIGIDNFFHYYNSLDSYGSLQSPELDLSKDGGKVNVKVDLAGEAFDTSGYVDENGNPLPPVIYTRAAFAMFNYNAEKGEFEQSEMKYQETTGSWKTYNVQLSTGSERSIVGIFATYVPNMLFIDNLKITQNYKAGDSYMEPFFFERFFDGTEISVPVKGEDALGSDVYHRAAAVKARGSLDHNGQSAVEFKVSQYTDWQLVGVANSTGIESVKPLKVFVSMDGNVLKVDNAANEAVEVYNLNGALVYSNKSGDANVSVAMPNHGSYIVKVGAKSVKLSY